MIHGKGYFKTLGVLLLLLWLTACGTEIAPPHTTEPPAPTTQSTALPENTTETTGSVEEVSVQESTTEPDFAELIPTESSLQNTEVAPSEPTQGAEPDEVSLSEYWNRGWYGWWIVEDGIGAYAGWGDGSYWWDCCADTVLDGTGNLQVVLWDEDGNRQEPMAEVTMRLEPQEGAYGTAYSTDGHFWQDPVEADAWKLTPDRTIYDDLLMVEGRYVVGADAFSYTVYLRPWGKLWDDWYADEPDCLPAFYESWYLPKLNRGVTAPPDRIGE